MRRLCLAQVLLLVAGAALAAGPAEESTPEYTIAPDDTLRVKVWGEANLDLSLRVRPDGKITFPLANDIRVEGLTPEQVRKETATRLSGFIKDPNVTVIVEQISTFRVYVLGEVNTQGVLNLYRPARLLHALSAAGGVSPYAKKEIVVIREKGGVEQRIHVDYKRLVAGDPTQENLHLRPGDTILVN